MILANFHFFENENTVKAPYTKFGMGVSKSSH